MIFSLIISPWRNFLRRGRKYGEKESLSDSKKSLELYLHKYAMKICAAILIAWFFIRLPILPAFFFSTLYILMKKNTFGASTVIFVLGQSLHTHA